MERVYSTMQLDTLKCYNWFSGKSADRILNWRSYRRSIANNHLQNIARDWAKCPIIPNYLEYDDCRHWPDPWTLISEGNYCKLGRALGMFYTLYYSDYRHRNTMMLQCFKDRKNHQYLNLVNCESGKYMLNYQLGAVVNISTIGPEADLINTVTIDHLPV